MAIIITAIVICASLIFITWIGCHWAHKLTQIEHKEKKDKTKKSSYKADHGIPDYGEPPVEPPVEPPKKPQKTEDEKLRKAWYDQYIKSGDELNKKAIEYEISGFSSCYHSYTSQSKELHKKAHGILNGTIDPPKFMPE